VLQEEGEGHARKAGMDLHPNELNEFTEESLDWQQFYRDLDLKIVGTLSKGSNSRLSIAVISAEGSKLYAFVRETAAGQLESTAPPDDA
jgi:hypothetical protein